MNDRIDIEKYRSIAVLGKKTQRANQRDTQFSRDAAAYKRLRADGHQPPHIGGSADLERDATIPIEIEMGRVWPREDHQHVKEGIEISEQTGLRGPFTR